MIIDPWTAKLSEYLDGDLTDAERTALERHLAACTACSTTLAELSRVVMRARSLPVPEPHRDLWDGIAERIATERAAPTAPSAAPSRRPRRRWVFSWPELVAAAIAIATGSGGLAWWAAGRAPVIQSQPLAVPGLATPAAAGVAAPRYDAAVADLQRVLAEGRSALDTGTVRVLERNLAVIDRAIADAQRALAADPGNAYLNAHFARTMRWKLDLLRQAATLAAAQS